MKQKYYFGFVVVALFAGVSAYMANRDSEMTDLMRANIEALSADEMDQGESSVVDIPCAPAILYRCKFEMRDATGQIHPATLIDFNRVN